MENLKNWLNTQRSQKGFCLVFSLMIVVIGLFMAEYIFGGYGAVKIVRYLVLILGLFLISWIDGHEKRIPNKILLVLFCIRSVLLIMECVMYEEYWTLFLTSSALGALISGGMFLLCYLITRGAMGAGDVKLMAVVGYFIGSKFIFGTIFLIVLVAAVYNVIALLLKKVSLKQEVPFGPFVLVGTVLMIGLGI